KEQTKVFQKFLNEVVEQNRVASYNVAIGQAQQALGAGETLRARRALLGLLPYVEGLPDLRAFDWYFLWKQLNGERKTLVGHQAPIHAVAVAPDGKTLASAAGDGVIKVWSLETGLEVAQLKGHKDAIFAVAFAPDSKTLASAGADMVIRLWDV